MAGDPPAAPAASPWGRRAARLALVALAGAVLVWPLAWALDAQAETYQLIAPFDAPVVEANRSIFDPADAQDAREVASIYGTPFGEPRRILFADAAQVIVPEENRDLRLLKKAGDENPLQATTVWFVARMASLGAGAAALALGLLAAFLRRRAAASV